PRGRCQWSYTPFLGYFQSAYGAPYGAISFGVDFELRQRGNRRLIRANLTQLSKTGWRRTVTKEKRVGRMANRKSLQASGELSKSNLRPTGFRPGGHSML